MGGGHGLTYERTNERTNLVTNLFLQCVSRLDLFRGRHGTLTPPSRGPGEHRRAPSPRPRYQYLDDRIHQEPPHGRRVPALHQEGGFLGLGYYS